MSETDSKEPNPSDPSLPLLDSIGRVHSSLRISVTDRCNIRCFYCMPNENVEFKPRDELLTFEEIEAFVSAMIPLGINRCESPEVNRWCGRTSPS